MSQVLVVSRLFVGVLTPPPSILVRRNSVENVAKFNFVLPGPEFLGVRGVASVEKE